MLHPTIVVSDVTNLWSHMLYGIKGGGRDSCESWWIFELNNQSNYTSSFPSFDLLEFEEDLNTNQ